MQYLLLPAKDMRIKRIVILLGLLSSAFAQGQMLTGWVIDQKEQMVIPQTHVINKTTMDGKLSDENGFFEIAIQLGDTIVFSNIAYQYYYFVYQDTNQPLQEVLIEMKEQNYLLDEVSVFAYELTTNKPKEMTLQKPRVPNNDELRQQKPIQASISNPAEFLYNLFGSKPRELRKLAALQKADAYRKKLEQSNNRTSVKQLTGLSEEELEAFMFYCKFAPVRIRTMNDYEYLKSLQRCYRQYIKDQELDSFLKQFD